MNLKKTKCQGTMKSKKDMKYNAEKKKKKKYKQANHKTLKTDT